MTTLARLMARGAEQLAGAGVPDPARDVRRILAHLLEVDPARLSAMAGETVPEAVVAEFRAMIVARASRQPLSHILGYRNFWEHRFRVTKDVLDPRPETEILVAEALSEPFSKVLDLGTGSGCILISLLAARRDARGVGTDISPEALLLAGENAEAVGVADRLVLPLSNWFDDIGGSYDLIVSNPPYIAADEISSLQPEVRDFEPRAALTDNGDGLSAYRVILRHAPDHLLPGGRLLVEIGASQAEEVWASFCAAGLEDIHIHTDLDGRDRVIAGRLPR